MIISNEIQEGIEEHFDEIKEKKINEFRRETEGAEGLLGYILNNLSNGAVFSRTWIESIYNGVDKKRFNEENIRKLMGEKGVFDFMNHQISLAMGGYSE